MVVNTMHLLIWLLTLRYRLKYKPYQMKDNLFLWFAFINNKKMRTVKKNSKSKTTQTSFLYVNRHALASSKDSRFLKILNLLIFNT